MGKDHCGQEQTGIEAAKKNRWQSQHLVTAYGIIEKDWQKKAGSVDPKSHKGKNPTQRNEEDWMAGKGAQAADNKDNQQNRNARQRNPGLTDKKVAA